jgi:hypothetical protein
MRTANILSLSSINTEAVMNQYLAFLDIALRDHEVKNLKNPPLQSVDKTSTLGATKRLYFS